MRGNDWSDSFHAGNLFEELKVSSFFALFFIFSPFLLLLIEVVGYACERLGISVACLPLWRSSQKMNDATLAWGPPFIQTPEICREIFTI